VKRGDYRDNLPAVISVAYRCRVCGNSYHMLETTGPEGRYNYRTCPKHERSFMRVEYANMVPPWLVYPSLTERL
jgi:hypothetical protein